MMVGDDVEVEPAVAQMADAGNDRCAVQVCLDHQIIDFDEVVVADVRIDDRSQNNTVWHEPMLHPNLDSPYYGLLDPFRVQLHDQIG